jgi:hypothetical protein
MTCGMEGWRSRGCNGGDGCDDAMHRRTGVTYRCRGGGTGACQDAQFFSSTE